MKPTSHLWDASGAEPVAFRSPQATPAAAASPETAQAADRLTISTDRPGFSDSTGIVPVGHVQIETGYSFTFRDHEGVETQTHNAPEIALRLGVIDDRLELRLTTSGYVWSRSNAGSGFEAFEGWSDAAAGFKLKLVDQNGALPKLALEAVTTLDLGSRETSNRDLEPTVKLLASWDLGSGFALTSNAVITYATTDGERFLQAAGSTSLGYTLSDRACLFVEYFVIGPRTKGSDPAHSIDFGGSYLLNSRLQLDARVGFGFNSDADTIFAGVGLSVLF